MAEFQAGGTDVQDRRRRGTSRGALVPIVTTGAMSRVTWTADGASIGALVRVASVASDPAIIAAYPGLASAAGALATPQIRAVATMGGALLQRSRCWYFRDPLVSCFKNGGSSCPARDGDHTFGAALDLGPCVWTHPSTLGVALVAYDATIETDTQARLSASQLFGDGSDPTRDHHLPAGQVLTSVLMGPPAEGEKAGYTRITGRHLAEWPLVEVVVRLGVAEQRISWAAIAVGALANVPLRLSGLERLLVGHNATPDAIERVAAASIAFAAPTLAATRYKLDLLPVAIADAAAQALTIAAEPVEGRPTWALPQRLTP